MLNRRKFLEKAAAAGILSLVPGMLKASQPGPHKPGKKNLPVVISTWISGIDANAEAIRVLKSGGSVVDAVEKAVMVTESDKDNLSVGIGGLPDREGIVTLDACIMGPDGNAGSVCFLQNIEHPISVARKVMEETPHVILAGDGALQFALEQGFKEKTHA